MATTHNLNNIVIDRVLRGIYSTEADGILFSINQVQNLSLNCTSESQEVVDALGVSIMEFMRSKSVEASAENAIFDLGLMAQQFGTEKKTASATEKLLVPTLETITVVDDGQGAAKAEYTLKHTPKTAPTEIYELNGDSTLGAKYTIGTNADEDDFVIAGDKITLGVTGSDIGKEYFIMYEYESENAVEVINSADKFPTMGKMTFECLVYDVCDPETKIFAYIILPKFQLKSDFDWSVGGDSQTHPFSGKAHVDYCAKDKKMVRVVIVDDEE